MNESASAHPPLTAPSRPTFPGELARKLAYAGLIPIVAGTLFVCLLVGRIDEEPFNFVVLALSSYVALVVSFLGGIPWGLTALAAGREMHVGPTHKRALWTGVVYILAAWVAMLMPPHAGLVVLGVLLIACYVSDRKLYPELGAAGWLTLRFRLTIVSSLSCFLAAAQI